MVFYLFWINWVNFNVVCKTALRASYTRSVEQIFLSIDRYDFRKLFIEDILRKEKVKGIISLKQINNHFNNGINIARPSFSFLFNSKEQVQHIFLLTVNIILIIFFNCFICIFCIISLLPRERWDNLSIFKCQINIRTVASVTTKQPTINNMSRAPSRFVNEWFSYG